MFRSNYNSLQTVLFIACFSFIGIALAAAPSIKNKQLQADKEMKILGDKLLLALKTNNKVLFQSLLPSGRDAMKIQSNFNAWEKKNKAIVDNLAKLPVRQQRKIRGMQASKKMTQNDLNKMLLGVTVKSQERFAEILQSLKKNKVDIKNAKIVGYKVEKRREIFPPIFDHKNMVNIIINLRAKDKEFDLRISETYKLDNRWYINFDLVLHIK